MPLDMGDNWCTGYYFRNVNPALRVVTVGSGAAITTLEGSTPVAGDLTALANRIATLTGGSRPYRLVVTGGAITEVTEMYQPCVVMAAFSCLRAASCAAPVEAAAEPSAASIVGSVAFCRFM